MKYQIEEPVDVNTIGEPMLNAAGKKFAVRLHETPVLGIDYRDGDEMIRSIGLYNGMIVAATDYSMCGKETHGCKCLWLR